MTLFVRALWLLALSFVACASGLPVSTDPSSAPASSKGWSREAILTLAGILVAIFLFVAGLASNSVREWTISIFECTLIPS